jgi:hypothetical protein
LPLKESTAAVFFVDGVVKGRRRDEHSYPSAAALFIAPSY